MGDLRVKSEILNPKSEGMQGRFRISDFASNLVPVGNRPLSSGEGLHSLRRSLAWKTRQKQITRPRTKNQTLIWDLGFRIYVRVPLSTLSQAMLAFQVAQSVLWNDPPVLKPVHH